MKTALIGGCMDQFSLEIVGPLPPYLVFPRMQQAEPVDGVEFSIEFRSDLYNLQRIRVGSDSFWFYVYQELDMCAAVRLLLERYSNHEIERTSFVYASDN